MFYKLLTAYPVIKYMKILQDLVLWSLGRLFRDTLIVLVVDGIGRFGARILEWYWKGWKGRCWIRYRLDYRSCTCSSTLRISTGTILLYRIASQLPILLYGWREVNYRKSTSRKSLVCLVRIGRNKVLAILCFVRMLESQQSHIKQKIEHKLTQ